MSDAFEALMDAVTAMHPITRSWLIHGELVTQSLGIIGIEDLSADQRSRLADGCHDWGELLTGAGLLWWDAEERLRAYGEAAA